MSDFLEQLAAKFGQDQEDWFSTQGGPEMAQKHSQSPIEARMATSLLYLIKSPAWYADYRDNWFLPRPVPFEDIQDAIVGKPTPGFIIAPQTKIATYTADFGVGYKDHAGGISFGAIECDGHNYHDLTKEQAIHDRGRDRYFQERGLLILRFTGSEIHQSPLLSASKALQILVTRAETIEASHG